MMTAKGESDTKDIVTKIDGKEILKPEITS